MPCLEGKHQMNIMKNTNPSNAIQFFVLYKHYEHPNGMRWLVSPVSHLHFSAPGLFRPTTNLRSRAVEPSERQVMHEARLVDEAERKAKEERKVVFFCGWFVWENPLEHYGKTYGKLWESLWKTMGKLWEDLWKTMGNYGKTYAKLRECYGDMNNY